MHWQSRSQIGQFLEDSPTAPSRYIHHGRKSSSIYIALTLIKINTIQLSSAFYNAFARRNSVFVATIFGSAFAFSIGFDQATTAFWDSRNKGVSGCFTIWLANSSCCWFVGDLHGKAAGCTSLPPRILGLPLPYRLSLP